MTEWPTKTPSPSPPASREAWPTPRPGGRSRRAIVPQLLELVAILALLFAAYEAAVWVWAKTAPKEVTVPKIVGLQQQEAKALLEAVGLKIEVVAEKPSETAAEGTVMTAEPAPERAVKVGRTVRLTVSQGSRWTKVPDVVDMSVDRARALLRAGKLIVRREKARYHEKVPIGYVLGQSPDAGERVARGTEVDLLVSKGPQPETEIAEEKPVEEGPRSMDITLTVPPGASLQEVRIVVIDKRGEHVAYRTYHQPGEKVERTVSGEGPKVVVRVYLSGLLVQEKSI